MPALFSTYPKSESITAPTQQLQHKQMRELQYLPNNGGNYTYPINGNYSTDLANE